jgi:D-alanyl-D-alanine carboxypeptidase
MPRFLQLLARDRIDAVAGRGKVSPGFRCTGTDPLPTTTGWGVLELGGRGLLVSLVVAVCTTGGAHAQATDTPTSRLVGAHQQALSVLKSLPRQWAGSSTYDCKTYENKNIEKLAMSFVVSAAAFLKAFVEVHGHVTIMSAYRTADEQTCVCKGEKGPCAGRPRMVKTKKGRHVVKRGTSRHQRGIALDVRAGTGSKDEYVCMHEFAQFNPEFGVRFPMGMLDRPHMEPGPTNNRKLRLVMLGPLRQQLTPCAKMKMMLTDVPVD